MASLSQALRLGDLPPPHRTFQGHATHIIEWSMMLRPNDSWSTCILQGIATFLHYASRRSAGYRYTTVSCLCAENWLAQVLPCTSTHAAAPAHDEATRSSRGAALTTGASAADVSGSAHGRWCYGDRHGHTRAVRLGREADLP